ncbi:hypothetical protein B1O58_07755 [Listeria monocytogenes]|nr:hypothetical protein [Listeria monocytogenes]EAC3732544.1 hypothetical protein [Listeria monocytogenes]EAC5165194.1 hypothetical protein [Listeria monocytogenes]EAC7371411.1 hypothetical protein [Listeria monocytogenes]EAC9315336.1 hypothetical protein [Listeria monocytogenes]
MENIPYVMDLLRKQFGVMAEASDFGYESVLLGKEELDPNLLPEYFEELQTGEELLIHFYAIEEYIIYVIVDVDDVSWKLVGIIRDGYLAYSKVCD